MRCSHVFRRVRRDGLEQGRADKVASDAIAVARCMHLCRAYFQRSKAHGHCVLVDLVKDAEQRDQVTLSEGMKGSDDAARRALAACPDIGLMRKLSWKQQRARKGISEVLAFVLARQGWREDVRQFV